MNLKLFVVFKNLCCSVAAMLVFEPTHAQTVPISKTMPCFEESEQIVHTTDGGAFFDTIRKSCKNIIGDVPASTEATAILTRKISKTRAFLMIDATHTVVIPEDEKSINCQVAKVSVRKSIFRDGARVTSIHEQSGKERLTQSYSTTAPMPFGGTRIPSYTEKPGIKPFFEPIILPSVHGAITNSIFENPPGAFTKLGSQMMAGFPCDLYKAPGSGDEICVMSLPKSCPAADLWALRSGTADTADLTDRMSATKAITKSLRIGPANSLFGLQGIQNEQ
jgi:hypothetical protein